MDERDLVSAHYEEEFIVSFLRVKKSTLGVYRSGCKRRGMSRFCEGNAKIPPCVKLGGRWVYPRNLFISWAKAHGLDHLLITREKLRCLK